MIVDFVLPCSSDILLPRLLREVYQMSDQVETRTDTPMRIFLIVHPRSSLPMGLVTCPHFPHRDHTTFWSCLVSNVSVAGAVGKWETRSSAFSKLAVPWQASFPSLVRSRAANSFYAWEPWRTSVGRERTRYK